jgi:hypothetical protein
MPTMKRSVFLSLNVFWSLVAGLVAVDAPERAYLRLQSWNLKPPAVATEAEVQAALSAAALPPNFMNAIASIHRGDPQKGTDGAMQTGFHNRHSNERWASDIQSRAQRETQRKQ